MLSPVVLLSTIGLIFGGIERNDDYVTEIMKHTTLYPPKTDEIFSNLDEIQLLSISAIEASDETTEPATDESPHELETFENLKHPRVPTTVPRSSTETIQEEEKASTLFGEISQPETSTPPTSENCETGFPGTFPDCIQIEKKQKCRSPYFGVYPDCFIPPCPPRYSGTYPKCEKPSDQICPFGSIGVFPQCEVQSPIENCSKVSTCNTIVLPLSTESPPPPPPSSSSTEHQNISVANQIEWEDYKRIFNKAFTDQLEEQKRQQTFTQTKKFIEAHNKLYEQGAETYTLAINEFSDWTYDEYQKIIGIN